MLEEGWGVAGVDPTEKDSSGSITGSERLSPVVALVGLDSLLVLPYGGPAG